MKKKKGKGKSEGAKRPLLRGKIRRTQGSPEKEAKCTSERQKREKVKCARKTAAAVEGSYTEGKGTTISGGQILNGESEGGISARL